MRSDWIVLVAIIQKRSNRFDSSLWYRGDLRRAAQSHFHRLRNGSSREVRKDCRECERWWARITPWCFTRLHQDLYRLSPLSSLTSWKVLRGRSSETVCVSRTSNSLSFSFVTLAWKLFPRSLSVGRKKQSVNGSRSSSLYEKLSLQICFCSWRD